MIYGYARVSTDVQDLTNQRTALKAAGCDKIFSDKLTGAHADRPQFQRLLRTVTQGDVVSAYFTGRCGKSAGSGSARSVAGPRP